MKILPTKDGLLLEPESEFESHWLTFMFTNSKPKAYMKFGMSMNHVVGLKIKIGEDNES